MHRFATVVCGCAILLIVALFSCDRAKDTSSVPSIDIDSSAQVDAAPSRDADTVGACLGAAPSTTIIQGTTGWSTIVDDAGCTHVPVVASCDDEFCRIPPGCYIEGSPETEQKRSVYGEPLSAVTLTHGYEIGKTEVTVDQWRRRVSTVPNRGDAETPECSDGNCPVTPVNWFEALAFANLVSANHVPPLPECYSLSNCHGELGKGMLCDDVTFTNSSIYDCAGYRLPTASEWEYAARAGTRTAVYSGDLAFVPPGEKEGCDANLNEIGWYLANSGVRTHPVGQKVANAWGLVDTAGNVWELTNDKYRAIYPAGPKTDPGAQLTGTVQDDRIARGGAVYSLKSANRAAQIFPMGYRWVAAVGLRLVRTLPSP